MRVFVVPSRYERFLESRVKQAVDEVHRDIFRRAHGGSPLVPDFVIGEPPVGDTIAIVGTPDRARMTDEIEQMGAALYRTMKPEQQPS